VNTRLVAEVSSNHHSDLERCLAFVDAAAELGCDAVKFQQFRVRELFAPEALAAHRHLLEREAWELPEAFNADLAARARERGIAFASTPFYMDAIGLLEPLVDFFKVASYQVLWLDLLREVGRTGKPVVLATGMASGEEVDAAVEALRGSGAGALTLLHCVSCYPTPPEEANLAAIRTLRERHDVPVGWSDHTVSIDVVARAVERFGAEMVEFHFDLDGAGEEYGGGHCWLPADVERLQVRLEAGERAVMPPVMPPVGAHPADGAGLKEPRPIEATERIWRSDPVDGLRPLAALREILADTGPSGTPGTEEEDGCAA